MNQRQILFRTLLVFGLFTAVGCTEAAPVATWDLSSKEVAEIESKLKDLPEQRTLQNYKRYYTGMIVAGRRFVFGKLIFDTEPGMEIVRPEMFPAVSDGGCDVLSVAYDVKTDKIIDVECGEVA